MRITIIGATGHVGTYLVPRLVGAGHSVTTLSRGHRSPYHHHAAWEAVHQIKVDRSVEESAGTFTGKVLETNPDVVIDMICFTPESARMMAEALRGRIQHFLHCGTIWVHGPSAQVPTTEDQPRTAFGEYGIRKAQIESYLLAEARLNGLPATILHPGHIVGPGWSPLNPAGHFNLQLFERISRGEAIILPNLGMETVHHVHADDVAQAFAAAITHRSVAIGESFHVVSPAALTLRGYAEAVFRWFGHTPRIEYRPWEEWRNGVSEQEAAAAWDHIAHSPNCSIAKARRLLEYQPRYGSLDAVFESLQWLIEHQRLKAG